MTALTKTKQLGDLIRREDDKSFTRVAAAITNNTGATVTLTDPIGTPLKKMSDGTWEIALAADDDTDADNPVAGFLLEPDPIAACLTTAQLGGGKLYPILARGPAQISASGIPTNDPAAAAWNKTNIATLMEAHNILVRTEPISSVTSEQTT
jgi:hypothetical protein